jgi:hypothetical protein
MEVVSCTLRPLYRKWNCPRTHWVGPRVGPHVTAKMEIHVPTGDRIPVPPVDSHFFKPFPTHLGIWGKVIVTPVSRHHAWKAGIFYLGSRSSFKLWPLYMREMNLSTFWVRNWMDKSFSTFRWREKFWRQYRNRTLDVQSLLTQFTDWVITAGTYVRVCTWMEMKSTTFWAMRQHAVR